MVVSPGFPVSTRGFDGSACGSLYGEPHTWSSLAARSRKSGYASVEMTKGRVAVDRNGGQRKPQISPSIPSDNRNTSKWSEPRGPGGA